MLIIKEINSILCLDYQIQKVIVIAYEYFKIKVFISVFALYVYGILII